MTQDSRFRSGYCDQRDCGECGYPLSAHDNGLPCEPFYPPGDVTEGTTRSTTAPEAENAFGRPVPTGRQVAALDCAADVIGIDPMLADPCIRNAARYVELDDPDKALTVLQNITDLTGAYRLLAVMCTD